MKNSFFGILLLLFALLSCRSDEDSIQKIDQIMNFYIKDAAGNDLLIPNSIGSYTTVGMNDFLAPINNAPVGNSRKMTVDSTYYLEYIAGATRELVDGSDENNKIYRSQIRVDLTKKISDTQNEPVISDTLEIFYRWTPSVFEVSKVNYNQQLIFTKVPDQPNVVTIIK